MRPSSLVLVCSLEANLEELGFPEMQVLHLACSQQQMLEGQPSWKAWLASSRCVPSV
jgi:hypothetical protein